jgi:hypothetical protein
MRLLTETPTHHPKNPVKSENFNHPTQGTRCNPAVLRRLRCMLDPPFCPVRPPITVSSAAVDRPHTRPVHIMGRGTQSTTGEASRESTHSRHTVDTQSTSSRSAYAYCVDAVATSSSRSASDPGFLSPTRRNTRHNTSPQTTPNARIDTGARKQAPATTSTACFREACPSAAAVDTHREK